MTAIIAAEHHEGHNIWRSVGSINNFSKDAGSLLSQAVIQMSPGYLATWPNARRYGQFEHITIAMQVLFAFDDCSNHAKQWQDIWINSPRRQRP